MEIRHGTLKGYQKGCRCDECKEVWRQWGREYRQKPEYKAWKNEYQKRFHANKMATDPEYREWYREKARKSAAKMRTIPEKWERVKAKSRKASRSRRDMIQQIKLERGCVDCGYRSHPEALEFDHLDSGKKFSMVSRIKTLSLETLMAEIGKCEVVCANCHRIRTYNRRLERAKLELDT